MALSAGVDFFRLIWPKAIELKNRLIRVNVLNIVFIIFSGLTIRVEFIN